MFPVGLDVILLPTTVARIAQQCPNVVGLKDASGRLERVTELQALGCKLTLLTGNDDNTIEFMQLGGRGVISVTAKSCTCYDDCNDKGDVGG